MLSPPHLAPALPAHSPRQPLIHFLSVQMSLFWALPINGVTQTGSFVTDLSPGSLFVKFILVGICIIVNKSMNNAAMNTDAQVFV